LANDVLRHGRELARAAAGGADASRSVTDRCEAGNGGKAPAAFSSSCVDHSPIVVPRGADRLDLLRIIPGEENELPRRPQSNATHPVGPERENVMLLGKAEQFACALIRMSQIVLQSGFDSFGVDI